MMLPRANAQAALALPVSNLLALDQSSITTGYAVFKNGVPVVVGHFSAPGNDLGQRLVYIRNKVIELIEEYEINEVVFEDIQLQDMAGGKDVGIKTFKTLAEVVGVITELLNELKIQYTMVPPIVWKATFKIAGKGRKVEKKLAQEYVLNTYKIQCTEDEADATCIGAHHIKKSVPQGFDWS